jgi:hypothetical protein
MERRLFLQLLAVAAMGPSLPIASATTSEHKNQTLLRLMDECLACSADHLNQKFDDMLLFINDNYPKPLVTEEEIAQFKSMMRTPTKELTEDLVKTYSSAMLETVFPIVVLRHAMVNTNIISTINPYTENWARFHKSHGPLFFTACSTIS